MAVADFQATGTRLHAQRAHSDTSSSAATELGSIASFLLRSSLQPSSIPTYQRAWKLFHKFYDSTFHHPFRVMPISPPILALFIVSLFHSQYAPSTVMTYVSCLGYCRKLKGFSDFSKEFYVTQMLKGFNKIGFRLDSRLPITQPILDKLISMAPSLVGSPYQICQFRQNCERNESIGSI